MKTPAELLAYIKDRVAIHSKVVDVLKGIVTSTQSSVELEYAPIPKNQFANIGNAVAQFYDRTLDASDMFGGASSYESLFPVISSFNIESIPDILNDKLQDKINVSNGLKSIERLKFNTLFNAVGGNKESQDRLKLASGVKDWGVLSVGNYWPLTVNVNRDLQSNQTYTIEVPSLSEKSMYSIIHLSPNVDVKNHVIKIAATNVHGVKIPIIFVVLDNTTSLDGDEFSFKIEYERVVDSNPDKAYWPAVVFLSAGPDSKYIPTKSNFNIDGINLKNNTVSVDGVEYMYIPSTVIGSALSAYIPAECKLRDYVLVSPSKLKNIYNNSLGVKYNLNTDLQLTRTRYQNAGSLNNSISVNYSNSELYMTSRASSKSDGVISSETRSELFAVRSSIQNVNGFLEFCSGGVSCIFGHYAPNQSYSIEGNPLIVEAGENLTGELYTTSPIQFRNASIPGPYSTYKNGFFSEFTVDTSSIGDSTVVIRYGHFGTKMALTLKINNDLTVSSVDGVNGVNITQSFQTKSIVRVAVGLMFKHGIPTLRYSIYEMIGLTKNVIVDSGDIQIDSDCIIGYASMSETTKSLLNPNTVWGKWNPALMVSFIEGEGVLEYNTVKMSGINITHSLNKLEFNDMFTSFNENLNGEMYDIPSIIGIDMLKGFICKVDAPSVLTYPKTTYDVGNSLFRVDLTYNAYKGSLSRIDYTNYDPEVGTGVAVVDIESNTISDSIDGVFGWKLSNYYQLTLH